MNDARGISRGKCKDCSNCICYVPPSASEGHKFKCSQCGCPPGKHIRQTQQDDLFGPVVAPTAIPANDSQFVANQYIPALPLGGSLCAVPNCGREVEFDLNSGFEYTYCPLHASADLPMTVDDIEDDPFMFQDSIIPQDSMIFNEWQEPAKDSSLCILPECLNKKYFDSALGKTYDYCGKRHAEDGRKRGIQSNIGSSQNGQGVSPVPSSTQVPPSTQIFTSPGLPNKCAIAECTNLCYVDESGTVHECCGFTHAMEHQRRQALWKQVNQQVVKGVTHCLLPQCNKQTWPFENYCGRSHADIGIRMGLVAPPPVSGTPSQTQSGPKDSSLCIIPGCQKPKYKDSSTGATHDYCGKSHAEEGKKRGINATADKVEDQCDLPGCTNKKRTEGGTVYDYCCLDHAKKDAPNRDAKILTSRAEVDKFLAKFPILKVVSVKENDHAKPGGVLFNKFKNAMMGLPANQRNTCLAFHGTAESNIDSICKNGYDPKLRSSQALGPGEYFAKSPGTPLGYCRGGKKILLNELLLGQNGTHHTQHGDVVVMKYPAHDLPRFVITFQ